MRTYHIAVVGATDLVGREIVELLESRRFPVGELRLLAPEEEAGARIPYRDADIVVQPLTDTAFHDLDLVFFGTNAAVSQEFASYAVQAGAVVIDSSPAFRQHPDVPLIVPEINARAIAAHQGILANPGSMAILVTAALHPIWEEIGISRLVASTYQAVSETGRDALAELDQQVRNIFNQRDLVCQVYPHQIAFNCLPHIEGFDEQGDTQAERQLAQETRRIFEDESLRMTVTAVRVPVFYGHCAAVNLEAEAPLTAQAARDLLSAAPGVKVVDEPQHNLYPLPTDAAGEDAVFVGRIREDPSVENGLNLWIVTDNLRKGAALNAVQIAECLMDEGL